MGIKITKDSQTPRFEFRPGVESFPEWKGIQREPGDPGSIDSNAVWLAVNARFNGVSFLSRGGQSEWNATPETGCIYGIFDFEGVDGGGTGGAMLIGGGYIKDAYGNENVGHLARYDEGTVPAFSRLLETGVPSSGSLDVIQTCFPLGGNIGIAARTNMSQDVYETSNPLYINGNNTFFKLNKKLYCVSDSWIDGSQIFSTPAISTVFEISYTSTPPRFPPDGPGPGGASYRKVFDLPVRCTHVYVNKNERSISAAGSVDVVEDVAYFAGINNGALYRWSQSTGFTTEAPGGVNYRGITIAYRENLYLLSRNSIRKRTSAASYSSVSLPALPGGCNTFFPWTAKVYKDKLYIGGVCYIAAAQLNRPIVLVYDGTTCTVSVDLSTGVGGHLTTLEVAFDNLYAGYHLASLTTVAKFDNTSWTNSLATVPRGFFPRFLFNGKDIVINTTDAPGSDGFPDYSFLYKTTGSSFASLTVLADDTITVPSFNGCPYGDMILLDQD